MKYLVTDIEYDIDEPQEPSEGSVDEIKAELPTTLTVEVDSEDEIADAISDATGWCVLSYHAERSK